MYVAIMQLEVSSTLMLITHVKVSAENMWVTIFIEIMQLGVSFAIMQVVFSLLLCRWLFPLQPYVSVCVTVLQVYNNFISLSLTTDTQYFFL